MSGLLELLDQYDVGVEFNQGVDETRVAPDTSHADGAGGIAAVS